jgi:hypothetical protein|tara:strand:+ start:4619 stop:5296 length:678 start_codon:yes stop_codon:yes gene_type:complete
MCDIFIIKQIGMVVLITEEQYSTMLNERANEKVRLIFTRLHELSKKIIDDVKTQFGISTRFGLTYGAGIGALMEPVSQYLNNEFTHLEPWQISSLVVASISVVFYEGKDYKDLKKELSEQGLDDELESAISKTQKLKNDFSQVLDVIGISTYKAADIVAYTFLLPILGMVINVITTFGLDSIELSNLIEGLLTSGLITISGIAFRDIIQKIAKTIRGKSEVSDIR